MYKIHRANGLREPKAQPFYFITNRPKCQGARISTKKAPLPGPHCILEEEHVLIFNFAVTRNYVTSNVVLIAKLFTFG